MIERKVYTQEFKREAVALAKQRGSITQTAKELGISKSCLHIWKKESTKKSGGQVINLAHQLLSGSSSEIVVPSMKPWRKWTPTIKDFDDQWNRNVR